MITIRTDTIGEAHEAVVRELVTNGEFHDTEDEQATLEAPEPISIHVNRPFGEPMISSAVQFGPKSMQEYVKKVTDITYRKYDGTDAVYTYGTRLRDHPVRTVTGKQFTWDGDGNGRGIDQLEHVIKKLKSNPETRRAIMHTWVVEMDMESDEPPCVQTVQFMARAGTLNMVVYIRSNDMLSAWGENAYGLAHLLKKVADELGMEIGWMETISVSAHLYYTNDAPALARFREKLRI